MERSQILFKPPWTRVRYEGSIHVGPFEDGAVVADLQIIEARPLYDDRVTLSLRN